MAFGEYFEASTTRAARLSSLLVVLLALAGGCCSAPVEEDVVTIDVHTHVFNGEDVPLKGFLGKVILHSPDNPSMKSVALLARPLVKWIHFWADGHEQELDQLTKILKKRGVKIPPDLETKTAPPKRSKGQVSNSEKEVLSEALADKTKSLIEKDSENLVEEQRTEEKKKAKLWLKVRTFGGILDFVRWNSFVRCLTSPRLANARRLAKYYDNDGVDAYVAAMVDLDYWLEGEASTQIEDQVKIMSMISIVENGKILPFVSYDPFRDVYENGASLKIVKEAIENYGFIGVKLYPAMGFLPSGNNKEHYEKARYAPWRKRYSDEEFAKKIEARLEAFYDYCREADVPIMAHCNDSMYSEEAFEESGLPKHWEKVLKAKNVMRAGRQVSVKLKVNLGHFGGRDGLLNPKKRKKWTGRIIEMTQSTNVYCDMGNFHIRRGGRFEDYVVELTKVMGQANNELKNRFMYGSDWFMMISRSYSKTYPKKARKWFKEYLPEQYENIMGGNALRFLGLDSADNLNRQRLEAFYKKYQVKAKWLEKLKKS